MPVVIIIIRDCDLFTDISFYNIIITKGCVVGFSKVIHLFCELLITDT